MKTINEEISELDSFIDKKSRGLLENFNETLKILEALSKIKIEPEKPDYNKIALENMAKNTIQENIMLKRLTKKLRKKKELKEWVYSRASEEY